MFHSFCVGAQFFKLSVMFGIGKTPENHFVTWWRRSHLLLQCHRKNPITLNMESIGCHLLCSTNFGRICEVFCESRWANSKFPDLKEFSRGMLNISMSRGSRILDLRRRQPKTRLWIASPSSVDKIFSSCRHWSQHTRGSFHCNKSLQKMLKKSFASPSRIF